MDINNIKTTYCNHNKCFICKRSQGPLRIVSTKSRILAFNNLKIFIKKDTRSCRKHLDSERNIKDDHYRLIKKINNSPKTTDIIELLNSTSKVALKCFELTTDPEYNSIFEPFKNLKTLQNEHCLKITGLTKGQFITTLRMLTKLRNSKNRTTGQLLALYRYFKF